MTSSQEEDHARPNGNHSPSPENDFGIEIERLPDNQEFTFDLLPEIFLYQIISFSLHQSQCLLKHRDDFTLSTWYNEGLNVENTALPNIPEFDSSAGILISFVPHRSDKDHTALVEMIRATVHHKIDVHRIVGRMLARKRPHYLNNDSLRDDPSLP
ncbi:hypothetical protein BC332_13925 [Capsicum chinense]|nr:hypothetical protein BC332_13925 [Capsicum chinense]